MIQCPRCENLVRVGINAPCELCQTTRIVKDEVYLRWVLKDSPHKWLTFDGEPVAVAVLEPPEDRSFDEPPVL